MKLETFHCYICGLQTAPAQNDIAICPKCKNIVALGGNIEKPFTTTLEQQQRTVDDYVVNLQIATRDKLNTKDKIQEELIRETDILEQLKLKEYKNKTYQILKKEHSLLWDRYRGYVSLPEDSMSSIEVVKFEGNPKDQEGYNKYVQLVRDIYQTVKNA